MVMRSKCRLFWLYEMLALGLAMRACDPGFSGFVSCMMIFFLVGECMKGCGGEYINTYYQGMLSLEVRANGHGMNLGREGKSRERFKAHPSMASLLYLNTSNRVKSLYQKPI